MGTRKKQRHEQFVVRQTLDVPSKHWLNSIIKIGLNTDILRDRNSVQQINVPPKYVNGST